ncbi:hypothetical protein AGABI2DRAFT_114405 [Agaricus bisporus var. bisporus H97]|uniref:hypothetical protein n=1 Tax=Agaricus bisporus var. bisporus (strain H97 / ATCC MYA-4626 / FGSC 10389) TaxID=936046 RepID=UPI00029F75A0|nr:hypothetical protein AGABI2DRAFT_114405 [Agaricus bisporus var. bisporus H97]EKV51685.1 hypothetical protein AGABI2DRAFT_114405 [Agaricus bisporus var. bisporus H97]
MRAHSETSNRQRRPVVLSLRNCPAPTRPFMTEYDFSSEAYDHYIRTQSRVASWVHHTEHHRPTFEAAAPGAPGLPPAPRSQSPPVLPRLSQAYARPPIYHRVPPSPSSSEASYVHVVSPQIRRYRPPPPPIYAPPVPPRSSFPVQPHPSPHDYLSQHRHSKSHSYSHQFPPPVATPIYTSPPISPQPIIYGYPNAWPTKPPREHYPEPSSSRTHRASHYDQPLTPPTSSSASTSLGNAPVVDRPVAHSRQRNLHTDFHPPPFPDDLRQHHLAIVFNVPITLTTVIATTVHAVIITLI